LKLSNEDKRTLKQIKFYTGLEESKIIKVFKAVLDQLVSNYDNSNETKIPYFGTFKINYLDDEIIEIGGKKGKRAKIQIEFVPDKNLLTNLGQLKDNLPTDIEKDIQKYIHQSLQDISLK
jgi:nucleoid DNA-binding protein